MSFESQKYLEDPEQINNKNVTISTQHKKEQLNNTKAKTIALRENINKEKEEFLALMENVKIANPPRINN